jgi:hypothetical protein
MDRSFDEIISVLVMEVSPYSVIYEKWVKARQEAYAERENSPMRGS